MFRIAQSTSSSIAGLSVAVVLVFVFAAATGCLIFKIRRLTNNQSNHSRAVFSNRAYRADSERKPDDEASINEVDLGVGPSPGVRILNLPSTTTLLALFHQFLKPATQRQDHRAPLRGKQPKVIMTMGPNQDKLRDIIWD
ncbi:hypothetical protein ABFA07_014693 [Porites harrisoni]